MQGKGVGGHNAAGYMKIYLQSFTLQHQSLLLNQQQNQTSKQASYHRVTADASSSGMNLHFLNTLRDRLSVSQLLQGQARVCQPISLSPVDKDRSDPYFLNNSQHFLVVIFFSPKHTLLLSFLGLCLPPALAIFICTSSLSNALVCSSLLSCQDSPTQPALISSASHSQAISSLLKASLKFA